MIVETRCATITVTASATAGRARPASGRRWRGRGRRTSRRRGRCRDSGRAPRDRSRWRCPPDTFDPPWLIGAPSLPEHRATKSAPAHLDAAQISSSVASGLAYRRLLATVPENRYGFWGTSPIRLQSNSGSIARTSNPSTRTAPPVASKRRGTRLRSVVFPAPVLPMIAMVSPAFAVNEMSQSTGKSAPGYADSTPRNSRELSAASSVTGDAGATIDVSESSTAGSGLH